MKAIILCAGYATRLYPLTLNQPKPLLPISGKPLLNYIIEKIEKIPEIDKIYLITNDKFYSNFNSWLAENKNFKKEIEVLNDQTLTNETRLGGLGDMWFVIEKENLRDDLLVVCGDNLFDGDLNGMVEFFTLKKGPVIGVHDVRDLNEAKKMGVIKSENNEIISFSEKPQNPETTLCSIGVYLYPERYIEKIHDYMKTSGSKDGPGFLIDYFRETGKVYAFELKGKWFDIGSPETYEKAKNMFD